MKFFDFNWFAAVLIGLLPAAIIGMSISLIRAHFKARRHGE